MKKYDLIIMGGGAASFAASNRANQLKKRNLMINDSKKLPLGGHALMLVVFLLK